MLVLSRQRGQAIIVGDDIEITVIDIRGDKVRIGVTAPREVSVHRREIYDAIRNENRSAAQVSPAEVAEVAPGPAPMRPVAQPEEPVPSDPFLAKAFEEALRSRAKGGIPVGAVLVRQGQVIARGHNGRVQKNDPTAHAEMECLRQAGRQPTLKDAVLYTTLSPCFMCSGGIVQLGVGKVVVGEDVHAQGPADFLRSHGVEVEVLQDPACIEMMRRFISEQPALWQEGKRPQS